MGEFLTKRLPVAQDDIAPDGSDVRILWGLGRGGMAHLELAPGAGLVLFCKLPTEDEKESHGTEPFHGSPGRRVISRL